MLPRFALFAQSQHTATASKSFKPAKIYSLKPAPERPVARPNDDAVCASLLERARNAGFTVLVVTLDTWTVGWRPVDLDRAYMPFIRGMGTSPVAVRRLPHFIGRRSMSKHSMSKHSTSRHIVLFSAAAFAALALTAAVVAPVSAQDKMMKSELSGEKTVMVGGAAMFPSKNIIQNAVNSKDHTTLVAAVKAAGLVNTLESKGPFTVFAPTNAAFGKLPAGTVDNLVKPENKATLSKILTYHVVAGKLAASDLTEGKKLKTVEGEQLTIKKSDGKVMIIDSKGNSSTVTIPNVNQSNGVIHVVDTVLMPS